MENVFLSPLSPLGGGSGGGEGGSLVGMSAASGPVSLLHWFLPTRMAGCSNPNLLHGVGSKANVFKG